MFDRARRELAQVLDNDSDPPKETPDEAHRHHPVIALAQLALVGVAVAPQLSAHLTGDTYLMTVAPLDPIDPFRGAYVDARLSRPAPRRVRRARNTGLGSIEDGDWGDVYVSLHEQGEVWVAAEWTRERPDDGPYLACNDRAWQIRCGIESFFLPQDKAAETEQLLRDGAVAEVKIDSRGNATVVDVRAP